MKYNFFKLKEIQPMGYINKQLMADMNESIITKYDTMIDNLNKKLFANQDRTAGTFVPGNRGREEKAWWAGEHEGYYYDGMLRLAILTKNDEWITRIGEYVAQIMNRYDETGYIGIYTPESRFPTKSFNGELWVQSRMFQMLLCWYEYTEDSKILDAICKTVDASMKVYIDNGTYFGTPNSDGGVKHAIGYVDTCEWLYRLTNEKRYLEYVEFIVKDMENLVSTPDLTVGDGRQNINFNDLTRPVMQDENNLWYFHTPHISEGLHIHAVLTEYEDNKMNNLCADNTLKFLKKHTNPGGGFIAKDSHEAVDGMLGNGNSATEYCSKTESVSSLTRYMLYKQNNYCGDYIEKCVFNTAQCGRLSDKLDAVMYLTRDNQLSADNEEVSLSREIFSCSHKAALCCNLNAIRLMPYFVEGMYMKGTDEKSVFINLYGASKVTSTLQGKNFSLEQKTNYPFSNSIEIIVDADNIDFELQLRIPSYAKNVRIDNENACIENGVLKINKTWNDKQKFTVTFENEPVFMEAEIGGEYYVQWGNLVFGKEIANKITKCHRFEDETFDDYLVSPIKEYKLSDYSLDRTQPMKIDNDNSEYGDFISNNTKVIATSSNGEQIELKPMGCNYLHIVTFREDGEAVSQNATKDINDDMRYF